MLEIIQHCLLLILLVLQIVVMIYLLVINHKQYKESERFWNRQDELHTEFLRQLDAQILNEKISDENEQNK